MFSNPIHHFTLYMHSKLLRYNVHMHFKATLARKGYQGSVVYNSSIYILYLAYLINSSTDFLYSLLPIQRPSFQPFREGNLHQTIWGNESTSHLAKHVPDILLIQEIAYQAIQFDFNKVLVKRKKKGCHAYPIFIGTYGL